MNADALFAKASDEFLAEIPQGQRTLRNFNIWAISRYNAESTRGAVMQMTSNEVSLLEKMADSGKPFDIYYRTYQDKIMWGQILSDNACMREEFLSMLVDNSPFLTDLLEQHGAKKLKPLVSILPGWGERGTNYLFINFVDIKKPTAVKPYQSGEEAKIARMFSGTLGPTVYSTGDHSIAEELLASLNLGTKISPNGDWRGIEVFLQDPHSAGAAAAYIFATMHRSKVIYWAHNWYEEVRTEIKNGVGQLPRILDFGASYVWEEGEQKDPFEKPKTWDEAVKTDLDKVRRGFETMFKGHCAHHGQEALKLALETFDKEYKARMAS